MSRDELETEEYDAWVERQEEGAGVLESQWHDDVIAKANAMRDAALAYVHEELTKLAELAGPLPEPANGERHANFELVAHIEARLVDSRAMLELVAEWYDTGSGKEEVAHRLAMAEARRRRWRAARDRLGVVPASDPAPEGETL